MTPPNVCIWCRTYASAIGSTLCVRCGKRRGPPIVRERARRHEGWQWDGKTYGTGPGMAAPCVKVVRCALCGAPPGKLCTGPHGPTFSTHYLRQQAYRAGLTNNVSEAERLRRIRGTLNT